MKIAFVMDPIEKIKIEKDTSYILMLAAHQLGHEVYYVDQDQIFLKDDKAFAHGHSISFDNSFRPVPQKSSFVPLDLSEMQMVLVRTDPPFDRRYFYTTLILDHLPPTTLVVNKPQILRDWNEKLAALEFPEYCPPTVVSSQWEPIWEFAKSHNTRLVIKPMDGNGGKGIEFSPPEEELLRATVAKATNSFSRRVVVQTYIPEAKVGDVRVLFSGDKVLGAVLRKAAEGKELNNLDQGGTAHPWELTSRQLEVCQVLGPKMLEKGVYFSGIDFLGDYLIEINVTSPTGLQELMRFHQKDYHLQVIQNLSNVTLGIINDVRSDQ